MNLNNLSIKSRLIFMIGLLSVLLIGVGSYGLANLSESNASLKTVYEDRVIALGQLDQYARRLLRANWYLALAASDDAKRSEQAGELRDALKQAKDVWAEYKATYLTDEEKALAQQLEVNATKLISDSLEPGIAAVNAGEAEQIKKFAIQSKAQYALVRDPLNKLVQLQLSVAKDEYSLSQENYSHARNYSIGSIVIGLIVGAGVGWWLITSISAPLAKAVDVARAVAEGDLTQSIEARSTDEVGQLLAALSAMNAGLVDIVSKVRGGADMISTASGEIAQGNLDLSARTEEQASSLEETASSLEELTSTVKQNADNATNANNMAAAAAETAEKGGAEVQHVVETMGTIRDSSAKIVEIISVIDGIAFQTNILALNAAVEAARAGEQGRGFAVVASEVRNLAQRSAAAAKEIKQLITNSVESINAGSALVGRAGETMHEVVTSIIRVKDLVGEISDASREQTMGIEQINEAVSQMDQVTQQNAALVEEAAAAAQSMEEQAAQLKETASVFKLPGGHAGAAASQVSSRLQLPRY